MLYKEEANVTVSLFNYKELWKHFGSFDGLWEMYKLMSKKYSKGMWQTRIILIMKMSNIHI